VSILSEVFFVKILFLRKINFHIWFQLVLVTAGLLHEKVKEREQIMQLDEVLPPNHKLPNWCIDAN